MQLPLTRGLLMGFALVCQQVLAARIANWAWNNMFQLALLKEDALYMGTCSWSRDAWVFNQSLSLPPNIAKGSSLDIFYRQAEGGNFTGVVYQATDGSIMTVKYKCNGVNLEGPLDSINITHLMGMDPADIMQSTSISVESATDQGLISLFYQAANGSALMAYGAYGKSDYQAKRRVTPLDYRGDDVTSAQLSDLYLTVIYAIDDTELFLGFAELGQDEWTLGSYPYDFEKSQAKSNSTRSGNFTLKDEDNARYNAPNKLDGYHSGSKSLAVSFDKEAEKGRRYIWIYYINSGGQVHTITNTQYADGFARAYEFNTYSAPPEWPAADLAYGLSSLNDYQKNYSRLYWISDDQLVYLERRFSDSSFGGAAQTQVFLGSEATATSTPTPVPSSSSPSQNAKIGIGVGIALGVTALATVAALAVYLFRRRRRRFQTAQPSTFPTTDATAQSFLDPNSKSPGSPALTMPSPAELGTVGYGNSELEKRVADSPAPYSVSDLGGTTVGGTPRPVTVVSGVSMVSPEMGSGGGGEGRFSDIVELPVEGYPEEPQEMLGDVPLRAELVGDVSGKDGNEEGESRNKNMGSS